MYYETADAFIDHLWVDNSNKPGKNSWFEERPATGMVCEAVCVCVRRHGGKFDLVYIGTDGASRVLCRGDVCARCQTLAQG